MPGGSKKGGGLKTKKSAFYLKSGNNTSFKMMGSSPVKDTKPHTGMNPPHKDHPKSTSQKISEGITKVTTEAIKEGVKIAINPMGYMLEKLIPKKTTKVTEPTTPPVKPVSQYTEEKITEHTPFKPIDLPTEAKKKTETKKNTEIPYEETEEYNKEFPPQYHKRPWQK